MNFYFMYANLIGFTIQWIGTDWYFVPDGFIADFPLIENGDLVFTTPELEAEFAAQLSPHWPEPQTLCA